MIQNYIRWGHRALLITAILLTALTLGPSVSVGATNPRYQSTDKVFSFIPPPGWEEREMAGLKYKLFITEPKEKFAPNLSFVDETSNLSLKDYVDASRKLLAGTSKDFKEISLQPFTTDGGLSGYRLSFKNRLMDIDLIQTQYYFSKSDKKLIITCSVAEKDTRPIGTQCDQSMKTFQLGN